ncbi:MAG: hypothetical protein HUU54_00515 [Ignavibacteriaceae bacterium]|nr:hypothetical protein [Ignavibacteriaceae bacterium]
MTKKFFLILFLFLVANSIAQVDVRDTIKVAALQEFNVPSVGAIVLANLTRFDFTAEILDANMSKVRDVANYTQIPKKEEFAKRVTGGRGITVSLVLHDLIESPGTFYIKVTLSAQGEVGGAIRADRYTMVIVDNPTMAAEINLRPSYFFNENEAFSFATLEYSDPNEYSYLITDAGGAAIENGKGPIVKLEKILKDINNVGKKITVKGFYEGKEFEYKDAVSKEIKRSSWDFSVEKPQMQKFHGWNTKEPKDGDAPWYISVDNAFSKQFLFVYMSLTPAGSYVTVTPDVSGLRVTAEPETFASGGTNRKSGVFRYIDININQDFVDGMQVGDEQAIKLTIQFRTQFGEQVKETFYATVIK